MVLVLVAAGCCFRPNLQNWIGKRTCVFVFLLWGAHHIIAISTMAHTHLHHAHIFFPHFPRNISIFPRFHTAHHPIYRSPYMAVGVGSADSFAPRKLVAGSEANLFISMCAVFWCFPKSDDRTSLILLWFVFFYRPKQLFGKCWYFAATVSIVSFGWA